MRLLSKASLVVAGAFIVFAVAFVAWGGHQAAGWDAKAVGIAADATHRVVGMAGRVEVKEGCFTITNAEECCKHFDGRPWMYTNEPCVPAQPGTKFSNGRVCQPQCWVEGKCTWQKEIAGEKRSGHWDEADAKTRAVCELVEEGDEGTSAKKAEGAAGGGGTAASGVGSSTDEGVAGRGGANNDEGGAGGGGGNTDEGAGGGGDGNTDEGAASGDGSSKDERAVGEGGSSKDDEASGGGGSSKDDEAAGGGGSSKDDGPASGGGGNTEKGAAAGGGGKAAEESTGNGGAAIGSGAEGEDGTSTQNKAVAEGVGSGEAAVPAVTDGADKDGTGAGKNAAEDGKEGTEASSDASDATQPAAADSGEAASNGDGTSEVKAHPASWFPEIPNVKAKRLEVTCWLEDRTYEPLDMEGTVPTSASSAFECQMKCVKKVGCLHFSFWEIGNDCHLQDWRSSVQPTRLGFVAGPRVCQGNLPAKHYVNLGNATIVPDEFSCWEVAKDYSPKIGIVEVGATRSAREAAVKCQAACAQNPDCGRFMMQFPSRTCTLAAHNATSSPLVGNQVAGLPKC